MEIWSDWMSFPDPRKRGFIWAPIGPGVYELRRKDTGGYVLCGSGKNCAYRMTSLLPSTLGQGTRKNEDKRDYLLTNLDDIEYRCCACITVDEAREVEARLKREVTYLFHT